MKSTLSANHIRSISASMTIVERMINDIDVSLTNPFKGNYERFDIDISEEAMTINRKIIDEVRKRLMNIKSEYNLTSKSFGVSQIVLSRKSRSWEVLQDTISKQLRGYGKFPEDLAVSFDQKIQDLIDLIEQLKV